MPAWLSNNLGCLIAFSVAVVAIYIDCYELISKTYRNVPQQFFTSVAVFLLAAACGLIAASAYYSTDPKGTSTVDQLLTLQIENPYLRAFYVGAPVLVLIRSQLFQIKGINFGLDAIYTRVREKALNRVTLRWLDWRDNFVARNLNRTFAVVNFANRMIDRMRAIALQSSDADYRATIQQQVDTVTRKRPPGDPADDNQPWLVYHETIMTMTFDICGRQPFTALPDFDWP